MPGNKCQILCKDGYSFERGGPVNEVLCQNDGTWDKTLPVCVSEATFIQCPEDQRARFWIKKVKK